MRLREYAASIGLPKMRKKDIKSVVLSFVSYGSCAVNASHGSNHVANIGTNRFQVTSFQAFVEG
jgi:hypothetical protein